MLSKIRLSILDKLSLDALDEIDNLSLESFGQKQGQAFHDYAWQAPYALKGYENMELSTQLLMFDAIQKVFT